MTESPHPTIGKSLLSLNFTLVDVLKVKNTVLLVFTEAKKHCYMVCFSNVDYIQGVNLVRVQRNSIYENLLGQEDNHSRLFVYEIVVAGLGNTTSSSRRSGEKLGCGKPIKSLQWIDFRRNSTNMEEVTSICTPLVYFQDLGGGKTTGRMDGKGVVNPCIPV